MDLDGDRYEVKVCNGFQQDRNSPTHIFRTRWDIPGSKKCMQHSHLWTYVWLRLGRWPRSCSLRHDIAAPGCLVAPGAFFLCIHPA